jgi:hypothetical protein
MRLHGNTFIINSNELTPSTTAYADGDVIDDLLTFSDVVPGDIGGGVVVGAELIDSSTVVTSIDLVLFDSIPDSTNYDSDNAALDLADTDAARVIGVINFSSNDAAQFADNEIYFASGGNQEFFLGDGNDMYGVLVARGTPTYAPSNVLMVRLHVQRDAE